MPKISVLMATYNNGGYLKKALQSILRQTYRDFELIVIDDGSTDNTAQILSGINDPRLKIITHPQNLGLIKSLNEGLKICQGEFVARMDGDDNCAVQRLAIQLKFLQKNKEIAMCGTRMRAMNFTRFYKYPTQSEIIRTELLVNNVISHPSVMWRRDFFTEFKLSYRDEFVGVEDYDLWTRVIQHGQIANLPNVFYYYRLHKNRETIKKRKVQQSNFAKIVAREITEHFKHFDKQELEFLFDFGNTKKVKDLKRTDEILQQILTTNRQQQIYQSEILMTVLAEKWLTCLLAASYLKNEAWQLWQTAVWKNMYNGERKRVWWLRMKTLRN